ncbi:MAG TPA: hypothetical protein DD381_13180 [Lentisphaeria bacterium]|nr:MAG: hypothetical protein A2X47_11655 [Lentisphaerae bacterium GWF2_38_69]HBM17274.1 hypothetical protein [Lentisphaeria bacterium]
MIYFVYCTAFIMNIVYCDDGNAIHKLLCGLQNVHKILSGYYLCFYCPQSLTAEDFPRELFR